MKKLGKSAKKVSLDDQIQQALIHLQNNDLSPAEALCRQVLKADQHHPDAWHLLGVMACQRGQYEVGIPQIRQAIAIHPGFALYHNNLGRMMEAQGKIDEALPCYQEAIRVDPTFVEAYFHSGRLWDTLGNPSKAIGAYRAGLGLNPDYWPAYFNLGNLFYVLGNFGQALEYYFKVPLTAEHYATIVRISDVYYKLNDLDSAIRYSQVAIQFKPDAPEGYICLGNAFLERELYNQAAEAFQKALALDTHKVLAYMGMGNLHLKLRQLTLAAECFQQALDSDPGFFFAYNNLADVLKRQGRLPEALALYQQALEVAPEADKPYLHSNLILGQYATPGTKLEDIALAFRRWDQLYAAPFYPNQLHFSNLRDPERRLRIGYVSPDFRAHSAVRLFELLFAHHDPELFELFAYSDVRCPDSMTARIQSLCHHWREIARLSHEETAALIKQDHIDILVDLAGHTANNRLLALARKPAPVQVTGFGFGLTTGMKAMDYLLTDRYLVPLETADLMAEKVSYISLLMRFTPPDLSPPLGDPPVFENGLITFGCGNEIFKINPEVLALWARILKQAPSARLHLKSTSFQDVPTQERYAAALAAQGIQPERLLFSGGSTRQEHMAFYNSLDIALDPFPYQGGISTCETLWMGVPVVTMDSGTRASVSILSAVGLTDLIASSADEYVAVAVALAQDKARLKDLKHTLRDQMKDSPLCQGPAFAQEVEMAYRQMWRAWCQETL